MREKNLKGEIQEKKVISTKKRNHAFTESSFLNSSVMCAIESVSKNSLLEQVEMKKFF